MPGKIPVYDRLGCRRMWNNNEWAQKNPITTFPPNNETVLLINWIRCQRGALVAGDHFQSLHLHRDITGEGVAMQRNLDNLKLGSYDTAWQQHTIAIPDNMDHQWCVVVDRDNTKLDAYLDGDLGGRTAALTENPDLTAAVMHNLNNSTAEQYSDITWRCVAMTIANGSTPTQAAMSQILKQWLDPQSAMPADLNTIKGSYYSDYSPGEGLYGATTITDNGDNGDDLTWQGGFTVEDVRARARAPKANTRRTFYTLKPGYTATTAATDFGFAVQPVIVRVPVDALVSEGTGTAIQLTNAAGTEAILLYTLLAYNGLSCVVKTNNILYPVRLYDSVNDRGGGDLFAVWDGTDMAVYYSGQHHGDATPVAALNLTGNCRVQIFNPQFAPHCRLAAWNPSSVPGTLAQEIIDCCMDPETDPPSLTNKLVDFPVRSDLIAAGGSTVANQGTGGGTLTLSAIRSTSCREMFHGMDP